MNGFTCHIEQRHIDTGMVAEEEWCPIALALREYGLSHVIVSADVAQFCYEGRTYKAMLSDQAITFIHRFDAGMSVSPFDLVVLRESLEA